MSAVESRRPLFSFMRRSNTERSSSTAFFWSSSADSALISAEVMSEPHRLALHDLGLDRKLEHGERQGLERHFRRHALHLVEDTSRLHDRDVAFDVALAGAHAGLGGLLGDGLVREHA